MLRFDRFQESRHHDVFDTQSCQSKLNTQRVSLNRFIDGHGHNNDTLGYEQCVEKRYNSLVCLKMSKQIKRQKKCRLQCFYFVAKVTSTLSTFVCVCVCVRVCVGACLCACACACVATCCLGSV